MDLSGQDRIKTFWNHDEEANSIVLEFYNDAEDTLLGSVTLEGSRLVSFLEGLSESARYFFPPVENHEREFHKTVFDNVELKSTTEFYEKP